MTSGTLPRTGWGMDDEEAGEGRESHRSLMRPTGQGGPSLWQEAEQEAEQKGSREAVGLQENCLAARAQPVTIALQEHQDHSIGPPKALLERQSQWGPSGSVRSPPTHPGTA